MEPSDKTIEELDFIGNTKDSLYCNQYTFQCALLSAGGAVEACKAVVAGYVRNSIAVIRPPGHHAEADEPRGFCFFDNVSIAALACQGEYPERCRKILIVDWDVHHGNGIQQAFYNNPNVLYISLHVGGNFYPPGPYKNHLHCGEGAGMGKNVNIPWFDSGMGDDDYMYAFQQVVMPIAQEFDPDFVIVASGFDAADGDVLGGCHVTPACYAHMTHMLMSLANGKISICLEGGYNLRSIAKSALAVTRTLMGEPPDRLNLTVPSSSGVQTVQMVIRQQSKFWSCLYPKRLELELNQNVPRERMHDLVRNYQAKQLWDSHKMTPLWILRKALSKSFENQVLAT